MSSVNQSTKRMTVADIARMHADGERIAMLTAYDYPTARLLDEAGIPMLLVGDSVRNILGYDSEIRVTMADMLHHVAAVARGAQHALIVGDMPFLSYASPEEALENAGRFLQEGGAQAVKLEGGVRSARVTEAIVRAGIPVMGHIGLTPQSLHTMGGYKVQGKTTAAIEKLIRDARALDQAGVFSMVLEGIPREVAAMITAEVQAPTIGIGAGPECDGQVLVFHDLIGLSFVPAAKFVRQYADVGSAITGAIEAYKKDVESGGYPSDAESYHLSREVREALDLVLARKRAMGR